MEVCNIFLVVVIYLFYFLSTQTQKVPDRIRSRRYTQEEIPRVCSYPEVLNKYGNWNVFCVYESVLVRFEVQLRAP